MSDNTEKTRDKKTTAHAEGCGDPFYVQTGGFSIGGVFNWVSRLMIAALFIITGVMTAMNFRDFVATVQKFGLPQPLILAVIGLSAKILGGLLYTGLLPIPFGVAIGRLALLAFTALATFFAHNPLKDPGQLQNMLKNLAVMGGLLAA